MTPEIETPFADEPRAQSPGEADQVAAGNVTEIARKLGLTLSEKSALAVGRFAVNVLSKLDEETQRKAADHVASLIKWWVG